MRSLIPTPPERPIPALPTLDPRLLLPTLEPSRTPPFPFDQLDEPTSGARLFYLARAGVYHAVRHLLDGAQGRVLLPAYHHGVEVEAARAAGARISFYRVDEQMRIDLDDLTRRVRAVGARLVYVTHYAGFAQPIAEVVATARAVGAAVFEDCALALGATDSEGRPLGSFGDAAVFCLYKSLPLPHGGLLVGPGLPPPFIADPPLTSTLHHLAGSSLAHFERRSPKMGGALREAARRASRRTVDVLVPTQQVGTMHLQPAELALGASRVVERLLARIDLVDVTVRRRRNYRRLAAALEGVVPVVGAPAPPGACPLFLPIRVDDKRRLMRFLHARNIEAIDFWSTGDPACDLDAYPEVAALRRTVLELPCHQSLDDEDVDRVAHAVKEGLAHG
jgi:selenocysteine lyase/cysteine desulfurase